MRATKLFLILLILCALAPPSEAQTFIEHRGGHYAIAGCAIEPDELQYGVDRCAYGPIADPETVADTTTLWSLAVAGSPVTFWMQHRDITPCDNSLTCWMDAAVMCPVGTRITKSEVGEDNRGRRRCRGYCRNIETGRLDATVTIRCRRNVWTGQSVTEDSDPLIPQGVQDGPDPLGWSPGPSFTPKKDDPR